MATERIVIIVSESGSRTVRRNIEDIGGGASRAQGAVQLLNRALLTLGVGMSIGTIVNTLANFSQEMSTLRAISGATGDEFQALREEAKRLGAETRFSATQAAQGMTELARAGFDTQEILASTTDMLTLAQAGGIELGQAAEIAAISLSGFRLEADQAGRVADVLAAAADRTQSSVASLGDGMAYVAPIAAGLGVQFEEAVAAMGALSDAGLQGSMAGTGLRQVLSSLEAPSGTAIKILRDLGVSTDQVRVSQVGLTQALQVLRDAGMTTGQALQVFGDRGGPAFEVLAGAIPNLRQLNEELENSSGYAAEVARIMDDNLNGAILSVRSAVEALIIAFGDLGAEGVLTVAFRALAEGIRFVANNLDRLAEAAWAFFPILARMIMGPVIGAFTALAAAILANPLMTIAVLISGAVAALIYFRDQIMLTGDGLATLGDLAAVTWEALQSGIQAVANFFVGAWNVIFNGAQETFGGIEITFADVAMGLATIVDAVVGFFIGAYNAIVTAWGNLPAAFLEIAQAALNGAITVVESGINFIIGAINGLLTGVGLEAIGSVSLGRVTGAGTAVGDAFLEGLEYSGARDGLQGLLEAAEARAAARVAAEAEADAVSAAVAEVEALNETIESRSGGGSGDGGGGAAEVSATFQELLNGLRQEAELLGVTRREREMLQTVLGFEEELKRSLTDTERELVEAQVRENQVLAERGAILDELRGPQEDLQLRQEAINGLFEDGLITLEEYNRLLRELAVQSAATGESLGDGLAEGLARVAEKAGDLAGGVSDAVVNAFQSMEDALVKFVMTGEFDFDKLVNSILEDLTRLAIQQAIIAPLAGMFGGMGGGGGLFGGIGSILGFANGGSFMVGGSPGIDQNVLSLNGTPVARVSRGETVNVGHGESGGRPIQINFNISTPDANSFRQSEGQLMARAEAAIRRASQRNN